MMPKVKDDGNVAIDILVFLFILIIVIVVLVHLGFTFSSIISEFKKFFGLSIFSMRG